MVALDENVGFGAACNRGLAEVRGRSPRSSTRTSSSSTTRCCHSPSRRSGTIGPHACSPRSSLRPTARGRTPSIPVPASLPEVVGAFVPLPLVPGAASRWPCARPAAGGLGGRLCAGGANGDAASAGAVRQPDLHVRRGPRARAASRRGWDRDLVLAEQPRPAPWGARDRGGFRWRAVRAPRARADATWSCVGAGGVERRRTMRRRRSRSQPGSPESGCSGRSAARERRQLEALRSARRAR